jgi:ATP phosphoribosyltransferase regulatory subunit
MKHRDKSALLPAGLRDVLPPDAAFEAATSERLMTIFAHHGYERVSPPLIEFEDSLLSGAGAAIAPETFRLMDPVSQRMMAVRSDMTVQVARIATKRLAASPRPLRLAYAGQVLRVKGSQLRPQRQFRQAGLELIGSTAPTADAEVVLLAADALGQLGVRDLTVDLNMPTLVPAVCTDLGYDGDDLDGLKAALDRKDRATVGQIAARGRDLLLDLIDACGPIATALPRLLALKVPAEAESARAHLCEVVTLVQAAAPNLCLTVDAVEHRGFEYHCGTSFTLFARGVRGELGRGGRYMAGNGNGRPGEPATGATIYMDTVERALPGEASPDRVFLPPGTPIEAREQAQGAGWITVAGLEPVTDPQAEARRQGCAYLLVNGAVTKIKD